MRRRMAAVAVAALALAACDGSTSLPERSSPTRSSSTTTTTATTTTVAPDQPGPPPAETSCPPTPERAQADPQRPGYVVDARIDLDAGIVDGTLAVHFTADLDTDRLVFRLWPNGLDVGARLTTDSVRLNGAEAETSTPEPTTLVLTPRAPLAAGTTVEASMAWRLLVPRRTSDRISLDGRAMRLGSFLPVLAWEPGHGWATDPPAGSFAEASSLPTADFDVTLRVPADVSVLASGVQDRPGHWTAVAARDFGVSMGTFRTAVAQAHAPDPVEVTVGVHAGLVGDPGPYLRQVVSVLEDFGSRFGPYPWPTLSLAITPSLPGGIEYPSHIMQGVGTRGSITSHELGHQWFYGLVGNNQGRDPWLDEGLATYAEHRAEATLDDLEDEAVPARARGRAGEPMTFWLDRPGLYQPGVYTQGAQAVAALGDPDLVDCALRLYVARNAYRIARPSDFVDAVDDVVPDAARILEPYGVAP